MLLTSPTTTRSEFEAGTGWALKPEGACLGDVRDSGAENYDPAWGA